MGRCFLCELVGSPLARAAHRGSWHRIGQEKNDHGKRDQERKPTKVQNIVTEALKLLRASIPASIDIIHKIQDDCAPVMGDATQIHQVIMNLCTNSYQAMQDKGGKLEVILNEVVRPERRRRKSSFPLVPGSAWNRLLLPPPNSIKVLCQVLQAREVMDWQKIIHEGERSHNTAGQWLVGR